MSETEKREAMLWECFYDADAGVHRLCRVPDMGDEIRRLRDENAALRAEIDRLRAILAADVQWLHQLLSDYRVAYDDHQVGRRIALNGFIHSLRERAEHAERILAALREPNDRVVDAVADLGDSFEHLSRFDVRTTIRAAVAAAEQEVGE